MLRKSNSDFFSTVDQLQLPFHQNLGKVLTELVDFMDVAIWELDTSFRIKSCNQKALATYGEDIIGRPCHSITIGSDSPCSNCPVSKVYHTLKPHRAEQSHHDRNGNMLFIEHFATPVLEEKGNLSGVLVLLVDITRHKKTEKELERHKAMLEKIASEKTAALAKSEGKFAVAFDASPDAININRLEDGLYVEVNKGFTDLTGFTAEDVIGITSEEIDIWHDPADRQRLVNNLKKYGYCENLEAKFCKKDGSLTTALMSARVISINDEPHIISITRDIDKHKEMERKVTAQQRLFETMFNAIEDGIVITDTQQEIQLANDGMTQTFGYSRKELLGKSTEVLHANRQGSGQTSKNIFNVDLETTSNRFVHKYQHKSGRVFPAATFTAKLHDRDGQWIGNLGIMRDITEQQKNEAEREKLIAAVQQTGEAVVITDLHGTIEFVNPAFEVITGYSKEEAIGENPNILKSGRHDDDFYKELWNTITSGKTFNGKMVNRRKDGSEYTEEVSISPVISTDGKIVNYVAVKQDITDQLSMEQQLLQAQKMEAVGQLTGGVAHDFNNMLSVILGYTEMALDKIPKKNKAHGDLLTILNAAERSAAIVRQLLAFSRQQPIAPEKLDLNATVEGVLKMLRRLIGEDIDLEWIPHSTPLQVYMDSSQIDQILANLCINAKDAIESHGRIIIETGVAVFDERFCTKHIGFQPGEYALLTVSDDGLGIKKEDLGRVYEPFFTTKELGRGTGLGLSTVYGIVKQNQGFIDIYSEYGQGTTVKIYLPFCHEAREKTEKMPAKRLSRKGRESILLVEDEEAIRLMVQEMLVKLGYTVHAAGTPLEAIEIVEKNRQVFDLLLTDVVMPEMNGKILANVLQKMISNVKCLYMSGYTTTVIADKGILGEDVHYIQKPFTQKILAKKIREALED